MTRLAEIQAHIGNMGELRDIVGAMRSLAGMRVQETQQALPGIRRYADSVAAALARTLPLMGEPPPETARGSGDAGRSFYARLSMGSLEASTSA